MLKYRARVVVMLVLVTLVVGPGLSTFAQGDGELLCQGLSAADCRIVTDSLATMDGVTAFAMPAWSINLAFDDGTDSMVLDARGSGTISLAAEVNPDDPLAGQTIYLKIDQATIVSPDGSQVGSAEIIIDGNMLYVKYENRWYGDEIVAEDLGNLANVPGLATGQIGTDDLSLDLDLTEAARTSRGADDNLGGQSMAVFNTNVDVVGLVLAALSSSVMGGSLQDALRDMGFEGLPEGINIPQGGLMLVGVMLSPALRGSAISSRLWVGLNDGYIHKLQADVVLHVNTSLFGQGGAVTGGEFHFMSELSNFNVPSVPPIPDSYIPFDAQEDEEVTIVG